MKKYILFIFIINYVYVCMALPSRAQAGQIKADVGNVIHVQPDIATIQSNSAGYGLYATDGGVIHSNAGNVSTSGSSAAGLFAAEPGSIIYWQGTNITTSGFRGRGIDTVRGGQVFGYGSVITTGERAHAIQAGDTNATAGPTRVTLEPGTSVHTFGNGSYGLHAYATGTVVGTVNIITEGVSSFGAHAEKDSSIDIYNSTIETHGLNAIGLLANTDAITPGVNYTPGQLTATSTIVKTTGDSAFGAFADVQASISLIDTSIETLGDNAVGLFANRGGSIDSQGSVSTGGNNAHGLAAGLIVVPGMTDRVKHAGSIVTNGDEAYGAFAQNAAQLDISGSIQTFGQLSHGALVDGATLNLTNLDVKTNGDDAIGLYAMNGASIAGQGTITTLGANAHGLVLQENSIVNLENTAITTYGSSADGVAIKNSNLTLGNGLISTKGNGLTITDSSSVTLINTAVSSGLSVVDVRFTNEDSQINLNIDGTSKLSSQNGVLLNVKRDVVSGRTGRVLLNIADQSVVSGDIIDTDDKTGGYSDVSLGADVTWAGSARGVRHFKSLGGNSHISFGEGSALNGDLHGLNTNFIFHNTGISIAGDMFLSDNSSAFGGSENSAIKVAGNVVVDTTSTQSGSWSISGDVENHGIIAPGTQLGTVTIGGDFVASSTSIYEVDINAIGQSDIIDIAGAATLAGRVSLLTIGEGNGFSVNNRYTILSAAGGLNGTTYDGGLDWNGSSSFLFVAPQLSYDAQNVYLTFARNNLSIASIGQTSNEKAIGGAIDGGALPSALENEILLQTDDKAVASLLSQLSGEAHQSVLSALQQNASHTRGTIADRLREAFPEDGPVVWSRAINTNANSRNNTEYSRLKQNSDGLYLGADTMITDSIRAGIMGGIEKTDFNVRHLGSSAASESYILGGYGSWQYQHIKLLFGGVYSWHNISMNRSMPIFSTSQTLESDYNANTLQIFSQLGYKFSSDTIEVEPFAGLAYIRSRRDGFKEYLSNGTFAVDLNGDIASIRSTISTLGVTVGHSWKLSNAINIQANVTSEWRHAFGDENVRSLFSLNQSDKFEVGGLPMARDTFALSTNFTLPINKNVSLILNYGGQFGKEFKENSLKGLFQITF